MDQHDPVSHIQHMDSEQFSNQLQSFLTSEYETSLENLFALDTNSVLLGDLEPKDILGPPERAVYPGPHNFVVEVNSKHMNKKKYLYSHKLNRIYVDIDTDFSMQFNWSDSGAMFVRATVVFADDAQAEKRVERCVSHYHESVTTVSPAVARNVLHSSRPLDTAGVQYRGCAHAPDSWLSVRVALPKPGPEPATHAFRFKCKNSCSTGINRRPILIIFTLEDAQGTVFGRQIVGARVCACPRRDMHKDEDTEGKPHGTKRRLPPPPRPTTKVKLEEVEDDTINLSLQLLSPAAAVLGLEAMIKMEEQALESRQDPRVRTAALRIIAQLKQQQDDLKNKYHQ